jgi:biopolymer transport protein ExbD
LELRRKAGTGARIPTSSMADIAFLLIVFFMVTTIFKLEQGLAITLPRSTAGEKIPREKVAHIWIDHQGTLSIDDLVIGVPDIEPLILAKIRENPGLIVSFNTDEKAPYRIVNEAMERLKLASALRVSFTTVPVET